MRPNPTSPEPTSPIPADPPVDCALCPRLVAYRDANRAAHSDWFNGAAPSFGDPQARLLIVGLAPGVTGANRTGRPFTGDFAGDLLYATMTRHGLANGRFAARIDDGLELFGCVIVNAVRCVPPQNKPVGAEVSNCRPFLRARIDSLPRLTALLTLGRVAHESTLRALGARLKDAPFAHGAQARIGGFEIVSSYHCSRYNTNTGRLTPRMFDTAMGRAARAAGVGNGQGALA